MSWHVISKTHTSRLERRWDGLGSPEGHKESYPVQVAEYAISARISEEPAFAWWASSVLKKRNRIIAKTKSKYWLHTHKFGIEIPKSVIQAR